MTRHADIADDLRAQIENGRLPPGAQLPSEAQPMEQYGVARGTLRQALSDLGTLVRAEHGRGVFVQDRPEGGPLPATAYVPQEGDVIVFRFRAPEAFVVRVT